MQAKPNGPSRLDTRDEMALGVNEHIRDDLIKAELRTGKSDAADQHDRSPRVLVRAAALDTFNFGQDGIAPDLEVVPSRLRLDFLQHPLECPLAIGR